MRIQSLVLGAVVAVSVSASAFAADQAWVNGTWKTYDARALKLESVVGTVKVDVKDSGPMAIQISGNPDRVSKVQVNVRGGTLRVESGVVGKVWDWRRWFDFSKMNSNKPGQLQITIVIPRGTPIDVEETAGNVAIGNTMGPLKFSVQGYTESSVGQVTSAKLDMAGSGKLFVAGVSGDAEVDTAGSGNIRIGDVGRVKAEIAGSGSISVGNVMTGTNVEIAGSGDFSAANVRGPVDASIAGSGSVTIAGGEANPLRVEIMGSGNVRFGGVAVNPKIEAMGSGNVRIKAYRGSLENDGAKLTIGN